MYEVRSAEFVNINFSFVENLEKLFVIDIRMLLRNVLE